ncbi:hypothetical protein AwWohl_00250 [Gammaproteobacteria bacterium]|nr:hypothetical protein AwWohl_00250 [Gammaproteobacteria bacterium]
MDAYLFSGGEYGAIADYRDARINLKYTDITLDNSVSAITAIAGVAAIGWDTVIDGDNISINVLNEGRGVYANNGGEVTLTGDTVITLSDNTGSAIETGDSVSGQPYDQSKITATGKMTIDGGINAYGDGIIDLKMSAGSVLTGGTSIDEINGSVVNMELTDSRWNMIQDSVLTNLTLNNSTVDFSADETGSALYIQDLAGNNGNFVMRINMDTADADKLIVTGTSEGSHNIRVINRGDLATTGDEVLLLVDTADGIAEFSLLAYTKSVDLGGYKYNIRRSSTDSNNWELYSSGVSTPISPPIDGGTPPIDGGTPPGGGELTDSADNSGNFLNVGYLLNYAQTQTLFQRMGELRSVDNSEGGVWVRAFAGKFNSFGTGKLSGFDMNYTGVQIGVDKRLSISNSDIYLGVMAGTTNANTNYVAGDGTVKGYHFGVYGSYVMPNDFYIDATVKYSHLKNSFNIKRVDDGQINSDASSNGRSVSLELGKRFYLSESKSGYYIEPQAQLTYAHQNSTSSLANQTRIDLDSYNSTLVRISGIVGYEIKDGSNPLNVYFKTGYIKEASGKIAYSLNGSQEKHDFGGSRWENGIGLTTQINKQHHLFVDGTYSTGSKFDQIQANVGYRYSF